MALNKINYSIVLRQNLRETIFVFLAFALMGLSAFFLIGRILQSRLLNRATEMIDTADANVRAILSEAETTLLNSYYIVQGMIERKADQEEILDYLITTTEWTRRRDHGVMRYTGIYGYINGELYDSMGLDPDDDYIPQRRPWYQTAVRSGNTVGYTMPYTDVRTGDTIISAVRNIDVKGGDIAGILVVDINITGLVEYVGSLSLASEGYGMLISQNMTIIAHPNNTLMGRQLEGLGGSYEDIARTLRNGGEVHGLRITDSGGLSAIVFFKRIFNGWYVGVETRFHQFYQDLYVAASILVLLGLLLSLSLSYILLRLSAAKLHSDEESKSKSSFLARMSHEIRTPMNAITGMAELLLREDLPENSRGYARDIKQAGTNLISIINDILDFSKIEAGKLEIISAKYLLSSLVNDTVNIIRMRLVEKPLRFYTNIDSVIPNSLIGDELRLRQVLLNLLSNAVKYSEKGYISMTITQEKQENKQVWLKITVKDSGYGIKPEDQALLFGDFIQVDARKNRSIEGTGLGLAITKRLCKAMGGDIGVESEYGMGSEFTVTIRQGFDSDEPFAEVENTAHKKVLIYEGRAVYANSVHWSLENMHVPHTIVTNFDDFKNALYKGEEYLPDSEGPWSHVFSGYGLYEKIKPVMEQNSDTFPEGKKPSLVLMVEFGKEPYIPGMPFLSLPVQSLSIANILNGRIDNRGYFESSGTTGIARFVFPKARILVVDDIATNLRVAEGLLGPYRAKVDTCLGGRDAIEMIKTTDYDIVFMDHMMPDIDGIEATATIRTMENGRFHALPIIALTANAISGMKEMFIEKGLNDFLAKPIDITKLDEILFHWIPVEKNEWGRQPGTRTPEGASSPEIKPEPGTVYKPLVIPGIDTAKGKAMTGGTEAGYRQILSLFYKDLEERLQLLQAVPAADTLQLFITQVHAIKSASATIGCAHISEKAAAFERSGKAGDMKFIQENLSGFAGQLKELSENIQKALKPAAGSAAASAETINNGQTESDLSTCLPKLLELTTALESKKAEDIDRILEELNGYQLDAGTKETLEQISDEVLMAEFDRAADILNGLLNDRSN